jgi:uncharacterized membrane protein YccC
MFPILQPPSAITSTTGLQYAARIVAGCVVTWLVLRPFGFGNPLWALISVIVVTEPDLNAALLAFTSRSINTLIGCGVGLLFLYLLGPQLWSILIAIAVSVLICTNLIRVPGTWRMAPITALIVMTPGVVGGEHSSGIHAALDRTIQVLVGSAVALLLTLAGFGLKRLLHHGEPSAESQSSIGGK